MREGPRCFRAARDETEGVEEEPETAPLRHRFSIGFVALLGRHAPWAYALTRIADCGWSRLAWCGDEYAVTEVAGVRHGAAQLPRERERAARLPLGEAPAAAARRASRRGNAGLHAD